MGAFDHLEWTYDGAFEQLLGLGRGEFEQKFSKHSNARGCPGGMSKLRFDWYINDWHQVACVASISVGQTKSEERGIRRFAGSKNGAKANPSLFLYSTETLAIQPRPQRKHFCFHETLTVPSLRSRGNKTVSQGNSH